MAKEGGAARLRSGLARAWWRDERVLKAGAQFLFLACVVLAAGIFYANLTGGLQRLGLGFDYGFLGDQAGFAISEGIAYNPTDTYARALWVGAVNTVRVIVVGIVLATGLGVVAGIARLSANGLARLIATTYVEVVRNVPLLLQLIFWYTAVILRLPTVRQSLHPVRGVFLNNRGVYLPSPEAGASFPVYALILGLGAVTAIGVALARHAALRRQDRVGFPVLWAPPVFVLFAAVGWWLVPGSPVEFAVPALSGFNFSGGMQLSPEFAALTLGLAVYTGAFIAEVVRGGIQAIPKGQREAASAVGLRPLQAMFLVILPQALRIIVPPLTNQYLNLAKNSSLAIAVGFPDLFNIGTTVLNQTGQSIPVLGLVMATYLVMSLVTSTMMNAYNRRLRKFERAM